MQNRTSLAAEIRTAIRSELEAISQYEAGRCLWEDPGAQELLARIANEERHHFMELLHLLLRIDPEQCRAFIDEFGQGSENNEYSMAKAD